MKIIYYYSRVIDVTENNPFNSPLHCPGNKNTRGAIKNDPNRGCHPYGISVIIGLDATVALMASQSVIQYEVIRYHSIKIIRI